MEEIVFYNQWTNRPKTVPQEFKEPTCTVPDQSMTIQEIIAKFTRTGLVPQSYVRRDQGGNTAFEPDFDPLDEYTEGVTAAAAAAGSSEPVKESAPGEPEDKSAPSAGNGGE